MKKRHLLLSVFAAFLAVFLVTSAREPEQFIKLPAVDTPVVARIKPSEMHLVAYGPAESTLLQLHKDGRYESSMRMHFGTMDWDKGRWLITKDGDISLTSEKRYHDICLDDELYIRIDKDTVMQLSQIQLALVKLIESTSERYISYSQLAAVNPAIQTYTRRGFSVESVKRLVRQIEAYRMQEDHNVFHLQLMTYKNYLFAIDKDSHFITPERSIEEFVNVVDSYQGRRFSFSGHHIFVAVTPDYFQAEAGRPEPFKFIKRLCRSF